ncbi:hypothetical protein [Bacillus sp. 2205SS5-2]|uniref:hypothetical protein n=1 Tax=Bacillus sp. 2205SS5-2 TaxID=3109031 RepID=UPI003005240A
MNEEEIQEFNNVIKIYVLSDEKLSNENENIFREFAMDLVDSKDFCTLILDFRVNGGLFENLPLDLEPKDYQMILNEVNSTYDISNLNLANLLYLSQDESKAPFRIDSRKRSSLKGAFDCSDKRVPNVFFNL